MKCTYHPDIETSLRCGKCGTPICPKCMVQTPVGARCPDCAKLYKLPTYRVSTKYYLIAVGTALGMAIVYGIAWGVVRAFVSFTFFNFLLNLLLAAGAGYAIGEVVSLSVNRKRSTGLAVVGGVAVVISYLMSIPFNLFFNFGASFHLLDLLALALGILIAVIRLR
ncbi:MAG: B-box zinc finger protein [Dehalococcoidales bacterium]|nr:B-box zinc finger protein [Dehalococcoidales bacterium]